MPTRASPTAEDPLDQQILASRSGERYRLRPCLCHLESGRRGKGRERAFGSLEPTVGMSVMLKCQRQMVLLLKLAGPASDK